MKPDRREGAFLINHFELFGSRQTFANPFRLRDDGPTFRTPFLMVRQSHYLGIALAMRAAPKMTLGQLPFSALMTACIVFAISLEESDSSTCSAQHEREERQRDGRRDASRPLRAGCGVCKKKRRSGNLRRRVSRFVRSATPQSQPRKERLQLTGCDFQDRSNAATNCSWIQRLSNVAARSATVSSECHAQSASQICANVACSAT